MISRFIFVTAITFFRLSWADNSGGQTYVFPVEKNDQTLIRPVRLMPSGKHVEVTNFYDGGPFNARRTVFLYNDRGKLVRGATQKINRLGMAFQQRFPGAGSCRLALGGQDLGQFFVEMITYGGLHQGFENQALGDMQQRRVISADQRKKYTPYSFWEHPEGRVQLEMVSWMSSSEVRQVFGGEIPWARIAEVEGPAGLSEQEVRRFVEQGDKRFRLKIRRATLYMIAGQYYSSVEANGQIHFQMLPWQKEDDLRMGYPVARLGVKGAQPFMFELGRASQIRGLEGEALELASFAAIIALHQTYSQKVFGWPYGFPPEKVEVYIHSLRSANTHLYEELLKASAIPEVSKPNNTLMTVKLSTLLNHLKAFEKFEDFSSSPLSMGSPNAPTQLAYLSILEMARMAKRRDSDIFLNSVRLTNNGPLIIRNPPGMARKEIESRTSEWTERQRDWAFEFLTRVDPLEGHRNFGDRTEDISTDSREIFGAEAIQISGLDPNMAERDSKYLAKILLVWSKDLNWEFVGNTPYFIATRNQSILKRALDTGLVSGPVRGGIPYFLIKKGDFEGIAHRFTSLQNDVNKSGRMDFYGGWRQVRLLRDFVGL